MPTRRGYEITITILRWLRDHIRATEPQAAVTLARFQEVINEIEYEMRFVDDAKG